MISPSAFATETRALFTIAWPMIIAQLAQMGTGVVDTVMAGHYSAVDLAAIAIGYNIWLPLFLLFIGMMLGATVIIAQDYGAGRVKRIRESLPQALWLALILGSVAGPLCYFAEPLLARYPAFLAGELDQFFLYRIRRIFVGRLRVRGNVDKRTVQTSLPELLSQ